MNTVDVKVFKGLQTALEPQSIERGAASRSLNWRTQGDHIELRRGMARVGADAGAGKVTGLFTSRKANNDEVTWRTRGKKLEYYNATTEAWVEVNTADILGTAADGEDVSFADYATNQGNQVWFASPNSSLFKIMTANPGDPVDQYDSSKNFKGLISIVLNRMFLWRRKSDKTAPYGSYIDNLLNTTVTAEAIAGAGATRSGTLAFKGGGAKRTCFAVTFTDGTESFSDDYSGNLTGSAGGTGTINYATGAYSITFAVAPVNPVTATYQWEDSTNHGIADFTKSTPRLAGQGFIFRQDDAGGALQTVLTYSDIQYCIHQFKTWKLDIGVDDTTATNRIFRTQVGIPNWRAAIATGDGIYYVDDSDIANPQFRVLTFDVYAQEVVPKSRSLNLNLAGYRFDKACAFAFENMILIACRTENSDVNNVVFSYDLKWKAWDIYDYYVSCFAVNNGELWAGDSLSNNVFKLFSGYDDDDSLINNYWDSKLDNLDIERLKKTKRLPLQGLIQPDQKMDVYGAFDNGDFVYLGKVEGDGSYVDAGTPISIGNNTIGSKAVGSGDADSAYNYYTELPIRTDKFEEVILRFIATEIGFVSVSMYAFKDIRVKEKRLPRKYRS